MGASATSEWCSRSERRRSIRGSDRGDGWSAVVLRDTGQFAGWADLWVPWFLPEILPAARSGGRSAKPFAAADTPPRPDGHESDYRFQQCALNQIVSIYEPVNERSGAVMTRLGFQLAIETVHRRPDSSCTSPNSTATLG